MMRETVYTSDDVTLDDLRTIERQIQHCDEQIAYYARQLKQWRATREDAVDALRAGVRTRALPLFAAGEPEPEWAEPEAPAVEPELETPAAPR